MTISYYAGDRMTGTTNDRRGTTWTNLSAGWTFEETDLPYQEFRWTGTAWLQLPGRKYSTTKRYAGYNGVSYEGMLFSITEAGNVANVNSTLGRFRTYTTATADGANAGAKQSNISYRKFNPYLKLKSRPNTGPALQATWFGWSSSTTDPAGDTDADSKSYFAVGNRSSDTNFQIIRNDGSASATYADTSTAVNNTVRTWELLGDDSGTRFGWAVDGGSFTYYTTAIPASTTLLTLNMQIELASGGVAKSFDLLAMDYESDA